MRFRGRTEQGEWVEGYYAEIGGRSYIIEIDTPLSQNQYGTYVADDDLKEIIPESLAMETGQLDKNKKPIFGSIELEDGTMSKGGDRVSIPEGKASVIWEDGGFVLAWDYASHTPFRPVFLDVIEIIGTQLDAE